MYIYIYIYIYIERERERERERENTYIFCNGKLKHLRVMLDVLAVFQNGQNLCL